MECGAGGYSGGVMTVVERCAGGVLTIVNLKEMWSRERNINCYGNVASFVDRNVEREKCKEKCGNGS